MNTTMLLIANLILAAQPSSPTPNATVLELPSCLVSLIDEVSLPAQEAGVLQEIVAKEGVRFKTGEVLGKVDETETLLRQKAAKFKLDVATEKATNDAEVKVARAIVELYKAEYEESTAINKDSRGSAIPPTQLRRQRVQWEKAALDCVAADMNFKVAGLERNVSEAELEAVDNELERRTLRAPFDGVVVEMYRRQSEWVQPGEPVLRFVRMDRLRIEGFVNAREVSPGQVDGAAVEITVILPGNVQEKMSGTISYVNPEVGSNREYRVWAEIDNPPGHGGYPWLLRPGTTAGMVIRLNPVAKAAGR
ncbi:MAG: HlyD family efflux transporter periplasmic adaptor subunit [Pirellulaceae bacterium]|jgi:multidrug resistance efflux pump|nr:HlyD family efflux transporter periplasmic adaptor subunit [Pirellulaceae bacterium]MCU0978249.1 HlyD family efflux transporter periplasmic adaptor subunit [Pirellulaceae bacterium]